MSFNYGTMLDDLTRLDTLGWEAVKKALNQRVIVTGTRFVPSRVNRVSRPVEQVEQARRRMKRKRWLTRTIK